MSAFKESVKIGLISSLAMFAVVAILSGNLNVLNWTEAHWSALWILSVTTSIVASVLFAIRNNK